MKWTATLQDEYGLKLQPDTAERWLAKLSESLNGVSDQELAWAIEFASQQPENKATGRTIELHTLRIWVKWYRKTRAQARRGYKSGTEEALLPQIWSAMKNAASHEQRWDIMCDPCGMGVMVGRSTTCEECDKLYALAQRKWGDWVCGTDALRRKMAAELRGRVATVVKAPPPKDDDNEDVLPF
jgi:hypothetical protein